MNTAHSSSLYLTSLNIQFHTANTLVISGKMPGQPHTTYQPTNLLQTKTDSYSYSCINFTLPYKRLKRYSMNGHHVLKELCQQLTPLLLHQTCLKSQKTIIDIFVTPNQWVFAQLAYAHRMHKSGFPFLNTDTLTLVAAYEDHQLIAVKEMICSNPNSFNLPDNLLAQIHTLPDMIASAPAWSTE